MILQMQEIDPADDEFEPEIDDSRPEQTVLDEEALRIEVSHVIDATIEQVFARCTESPIMPEETFVRSMLGAQSIAHKTSAPMYGFGSGTRSQLEKIFVSQEHSALESGKESPGPAVYKHRAAVGSGC